MALKCTTRHSTTGKKTIDRTNLDYFDKELLETDIGPFAMYEGNHVPLDCPMIEEEKQPELNKPKAGDQRNTMCM